jgi:hypothetical protein
MSENTCHGKAHLTPRQTPLPDFLQRHLDAGALLRVDAEVIVEAYPAEIVASMENQDPEMLRIAAHEARMELRRIEGLPTPDEDSTWRG